MAGVSVDTGSGGRRAIDANVNMVPMIDLLVSTIAFLLMTAVWTQTGAVRSTQPRTQPSDNPITAPAEDQLRVVVSPTGFDVGRNALDMRHLDTDLRALRAELDARRRADPSTRDVWIQPDAAVQYDQVVRVMDTVYDAWSDPSAASRPRHERVTVSLM
ncbi:MAG: biopolymer transporter ExbD [Polyangiales bacterium]